MHSDRMSDEELELLAPWNENVKTEIQHRVNNTDQSDVNCQGAPATEKVRPGNFLSMAEIYALTSDRQCNLTKGNWYRYGKYNNYFSLLYNRYMFSRESKQN